MPATLTLYGRQWCHLCDDMRVALAPLQEEFGFDLQVVDVDTDPALDAKFGEFVPVLCAGEQRLCHYFLDAAAVRDFLGKNR